MSISLNLSAFNSQLFLSNIWSPQFKTYTVDDGLSQSMAEIVLQDKNEFIWIVTPTGVDRFNGFEFESIKFEPSNSEASLKTIIGLFLNNQQIITAVSNRGVIYTFDEELKYFAISYVPENKTKISHALILDDNNYLFFSGHGIKKIDVINNKLMQSAIELPVLNNIDDTHDIEVDNDNIIWISTESGQLFSYDQLTNQSVAHQFSHSVHIKKEPISITPSQEHGIFAGFLSGELYSLNHNSVLATPLNLEYAKTPIASKIKDLIQAPDGILWLATLSNGLYRISIVDNSVQQYKTTNKGVGSLSSNDIYHLYLDKQGGLWASSPNGINYAQVINNRFFQIGGNKAYSQPLSSLYISSILSDASQKIWVGSHDSGLSQLSKGQLSKNQSPTANTQDSDLKISNIHFPKPVNIRDIAQSADGKIWIASNEDLKWFDGVNNNPIQLTKEWQDFSTNGVDSMNISNHGKLLINKLGDVIFENKEGIFFQNKIADQADLVEIFDIAGPYNHLYWIAAGNSGMLYQFNSLTNKLKKIDVVKQNGLVINSVLSVFLSPTNDLWIGTYGDGLLRQNIMSNQQTWLDTDNGLADNFIYGVNLDSKNNLWVMSNKGLSRLNLATLKIQNFTVKDGIQSNEFNYKSTYRSNEGLLFFGGINGVTVIDENRFELNKHLPKTYIQDAFLMTNAGEQRLRISQNKIEGLSYFSNSLSFKIGAIELINPNGNHYQYRLIGQNDEWIDLANKREITLLSLPSNDYHLQVTSCNSEGSCNLEPVEVYFSIPPPPWLSWWAYIIYNLMLLSLVVYYFKNHQKQLAYEKNEALKEKQMADKLRDLNELKDQFLTNTSHELRTPLNGIIGLSEIIILDPDNGISEESLASVKAINHCGHQLNTLVEDLLDFAQLQNKRLIIKSEKFDINELVNHVVLLLQPQAKKRNLIIKAIYLNKPTQVFADINRIRQVIYNLVNNAIKFSNSGTINIILLEMLPLIKITVKDQGIGIAKHLQEKVFESFTQVDGSNQRVSGGIGLGLAISKDIIELHGGELKISSEPGAGTEFSFKLTTLSKNNICL